METENVVIVMGADTPTGMTTVRALNKSPVLVVGAYENPNSVTLTSQYWHALYEVSGTIDVQFDKLIEIYKSKFLNKKVILLFTGDEQILGYWEFGAKLEQYFTIPIVGHESGKILMDKAQFHDWAIAKGVGVPPSLTIQGKLDFAELSSFSFFPCVLKPNVRTKSWNKKFPNEKLLRFDSKHRMLDFLEYFPLFNYSPSYLLQKWVPGNDSSIYFVLYAHDLDGKLLSRIGGRKRLQWPPDFGSTAVCEVCNDEALYNAGEEILKHLSLVGLNSIEFKRDPDSGTFYVTEPTVGRNDYQSGLSSFMKYNLTHIVVESIFSPSNYITISDSNFRGLWIDEISVLRHLKKNNVFFLFNFLALLVKNRFSIGFLYFSIKDSGPFIKIFKKNLKKITRSK